MNPKRISRDDLLDDPRFWAILYEYWVKPCVGDVFEDGEQYFFSVRQEAVNAFFRDLETMPNGANYYPEYSVLLPLRNGWRIGVSLSMYPDDFGILDVVVPPFSDELVIFGENGGNFKLPALRWDELLLLRDSVRPPTPTIKARAILLLFPSIVLSSQLNISMVRQVLQHAWEESGIAIEHVNELIARPIENYVDSRRRNPDVKETLWQSDLKYGWINDCHHSLRNPKVDGSLRVLPVIQELFSTL